MLYDSAMAIIEKEILIHAPVPALMEARRAEFHVLARG
jgi:hypothetical protein